MCQLDNCGCRVGATWHIVGGECDVADISRRRIGLDCKGNGWMKISVKFGMIFDFWGMDESDMCRAGVT